MKTDNVRTAPVTEKTAYYEAFREDLNRGAQIKYANTFGYFSDYSTLLLTLRR